jgi:hypothetical protein
LFVNVFLAWIFHMTVIFEDVVCSRLRSCGELIVAMSVPFHTSVTPSAFNLGQYGRSGFHA